ncbi:MAG: hypothetical protein M1129_04215 [Candidatus Thermoplasmatota archaeon]|nr:hypothetical protein [Candidatus Thermoplasmatota archaeon]
MKGLEVPENIDIWGELSPKVRLDLVALARLRRVPLKRILVEAILGTIESLSEVGGNLRDAYREEFEELDLLKDD